MAPSFTPRNVSAYKSMEDIVEAAAQDFETAASWITSRHDSEKLVKSAAAVRGELRDLRSNLDSDDKHIDSQISCAELPCNEYLLSSD
jgi:hypothetical protein